VTLEFGPRRVRSLSAAAACALLVTVTPARAEPFGWPQVQGVGTPVVLTYSFINLLDPAFQGISEAELRAATAQALGLWAQYSPLHFVERPDSGPAASDQNYFPDGHPDIRIGAHDEGVGEVLAHAFPPVPTDISGLSGDIHFNSDSVLPWGIETGFPAIDFLEVMVHELGHALGLQHVMDVDAIMNPSHGFRFTNGSAFLLAPDVDAIQAIYGAGVGSVAPIAEPSTFMLVFAGPVVALIRRIHIKRARHASRNSG
jgi:matrixin